MKKNKEILYLSGLISESKSELKHYMFFSNLKAIKSKVEDMLAMDPKKLDKMIDDGHDWANEHIATSKDDVEEVHNWIMGQKDSKKKK
jgi:hypothetical protein